MESECESNTIKLANKLNYDINPSRYIQKSKFLFSILSNLCIKKKMVSISHF